MDLGGKEHQGRWKYCRFPTLNHLVYSAALNRILEVRHKDERTSGISFVISVLKNQCVCCREIRWGVVVLCEVKYGGIHSFCSIMYSYELPPETPFNYQNVH